MKFCVIGCFFLCIFCYGQQQVEILRKNLQSNDFLLKSQTLQEVMFMYEDAEPLIPDLLKMLVQEKGQNKYLVIQALGNIGEKAQIALPDLQKILKEGDDFFLCYYSVIALGQIKNPQVIPDLLEKMDHEEPNVRAAVISALNTISPPNVISLFKKYSDDPDALVQKTIIGCMQLRKFDNDVSDILIKNLSHPDVDVRFLAVQLLEITPENAETVLPLYIKYLNSQDPRIVTGILGDFAIAPKLVESVIPHIIPFLMKKKYNTYAAYTLKKIGDSCLPYLDKLLKSSVVGERQQAVNMISKLEYSNAYSDSFIRMSIEEENPSVRASCLVALSKVNTISPESKSYLNEQLFSEKQINVIQTMGVLKMTSFVPELTELLKKEDLVLRKNLYIALASIALKKPDIDVVLVEGLKEDDEEIKKTLIRGLGKIKSKAAVPEFKKMLDNKSPFYVLVILALGEIGEDAVAVLPDIHNIFHQNSDRIVKNYCMHTMVKMGSSAAPFFLKSLDYTDNTVRYYSLVGLIQMEPTDEILAKLKEVSERDIPVVVKKKALQVHDYLVNKKKKDN